jgi:hypothetical protein
VVNGIFVYSRYNITINITETLYSRLLVRSYKKVIINVKNINADIYMLRGELTINTSEFNGNKQGSFNFRNDIDNYINQQIETELTQRIIDTFSEEISYESEISNIQDTNNISFINDLQDTNNIHETNNIQERNDIHEEINDNILREHIMNNNVSSHDKCCCVIC